MPERSLPSEYGCRFQERTFGTQYTYGGCDSVSSRLKKWHVDVKGTRLGCEILTRSRPDRSISLVNQGVCSLTGS